jgi:hypothetical protein
MSRGYLSTLLCPVAEFEEATSGEGLSDDIEAEEKVDKRDKAEYCGGGLDGSE